MKFNDSLKSFYSEKMIDPEGEDIVMGYKILKINGSRRQMEQVYQQLKMLGIEFEEIEDGMLKEMEQLTVPNFDSFVAFDIEHTGTYGAKKGDAPAEITEIGAVKVINGQIVDHFDRLVNPGRKITPQNERMTHITNEMVKDCPTIDTVIKDFKNFFGDLILIGHNIKNADLPFIQRVANKNGIQFDNKWFDTYIYASNFKEDNNWENVNLAYLAVQFDIKDESHHRANNDAQVNAEVYFKLQELCSEM